MKLLSFSLFALICTGLHASTAKLTQSVDLPIVIEGKTVGSMKLPLGSEVEVVSVSGTNAVIRRGDGTYSIAASAVPAPLATPTPAAVVVATPTATPTPALRKEGVSITKSEAHPSELDIVTYDVTIETTFVVPANKSDISEIDVYRGLPPKRPWSDSEGGYGVTNLRYTPANGKITHYEPGNYNYLIWRDKGYHKPGQKLTFSSTYTIKSAQRPFDPAIEKVTWDDFKLYPQDRDAAKEMERLRGFKKINPEVERIANEFKKSLSPYATLAATCDWIRSNMSYDASVPYTDDDIKSIVECKKGHCGHHYRLLKEFMDCLGIPIRRVGGLNLYAPDGNGKLSAVRSDWVNVHTWGEIYLPNIGWLEIEPTGQGVQIFEIPVRCIQNDKFTSNYAVTYYEGGVLKRPVWIANGHGFDSDCGIENKITFTKRSP